MSLFKTFIETDIFGFGEIEAKKRDEEEIPDDDQPIRPFSVAWMMDVLARKKIGGRVKASHAFLDQVTWGEGKVGSVRVKLTPNIAVFIERAVDDVQGQRTWVCKKVFKPNLKEYAGREEVVANDVFKEVEKLYDTKIDTATEEHDYLINLVKRMAARLKAVAPEIFVFQDVKEINQNYYVIYFSLKGVGVGKLATKGRRVTQTPEATIDVNFNKERGLIHVILTTVTIGGEGDDWQLDIPYLDAFYAPSQNKDEIIDTVITALKYL